MGTQLAPKKGHSPPLFGPCLLWPNGWMDQDATWYKGRPQAGQHCVRCGPSSTPQEAQHAPLFGPCLLWPQSPILATAELVFAQLSLLPNAQTPMIYVAFQLARHPKSAPSCGASNPHVIHVPSTHPIQHSKLHLNDFSHLFHSSQQKVAICYNVHYSRAIKKIIAAVNAIKKLVILQP